eukprot:24202-Rhodomonas_salina.3
MFAALLCPGCLFSENNPRAVWQFMQKKAAAVSAGSDALKPVARGVAERVSGQGETSVIHLDGEGSPLVRHFPGRRSFGKFNATVSRFHTKALTGLLLTCTGMFACRFCSGTCQSVDLRLAYQNR